MWGVIVFYLVGRLLHSYLHHFLLHIITRDSLRLMNSRREIFAMMLSRTSWYLLNTRMKVCSQQVKYVAASIKLPSNRTMIFLTSLTKIRCSCKCDYQITRLFICRYIMYKLVCHFCFMMGFFFKGNGSLWIKIY